MSVQVTLVCSRIGCFVEFRASADLGWATIAETRAEARKAGWSYRRNTGGKHKFDEDFCPDHKDMRVLSDEQYRIAAERIRSRTEGNWRCPEPVETTRS